MESLIGWNFDLRKQTSLGIFGKVLGWCDPTEEQARISLHSHVLLFIAEFDALVSMLWSDCDTIREAAQKELTTYMMKTMSSTYDLKEEDFIHEKPLKSATISNHQDTVQDGQTLENTHNSLTVLRQEGIHWKVCSMWRKVYKYQNSMECYKTLKSTMHRNNGLPSF
jgi:hypothetical protein